MSKHSLTQHLCMHSILQLLPSISCSLTHALLSPQVGSPTAWLQEVTAQYQLALRKTEALQAHILLLKSKVCTHTVGE